MLGVRKIIRKIANLIPSCRNENRQHASTPARQHASTPARQHASRERGCDILQIIRRATRHAWLLHGYIIGCLMVLPFPRSFADEDGFSLLSTESYVEITLSAPGGTTGLIPGASRTVAITVCTHSWEVWTHSATGETQVRSENFQPCDGVALTASIQSGDGTVSLASSTTGTAGTATATYVSGTGASQVLVAVPALGAGATIDFSPPDPETWGYDHSEGLIHASLSADGSTDGLSEGDTRTIQVAVDYSTWDVHISSYGNTTTNSFSTSPATGATITWTVLEGDGTVSAETNQTDAGGHSSASFTMGTGPCIVRADVAYGTSHTTSATISFQPPPDTGFSYSHSDQSYAVEEVSVSGTTDGLSAGDQRTISGVLYWQTWDVWTDGNGNTETRNLEKTGLSGGQVSAMLESGDGVVSPGTTAGANGEFSLIFTMGEVASRILVYPAGNSPDFGSSEVVFSPVPEVWSHTGDGSGYSLEFDADSYDLVPGQQQVLTALLRNEQWEVWTSNLGNTEERNRSSTPASGEALTFAVDSGDGTLSSGTRITGTDGRASVTFIMGNETALASVSNLEGTEVVVTDSVQLNLTAEEWTYHHDEATIAINLTANGSTANLSPGTTRDLNAQVSYTNWHIWTSNWGGYERRYEGSGAANGATVEFSVAEGDGLIGDAAPAIDLNGHASANFTMGSGESRVNLSVSYAGALASASIWLLASSWAIVKREKELAVELESDPNSGTVRATAYLKNWSIATDGQSFRKADEAISPATGAQVFFRIDSGTLGASVASTDQDGRACTSYQISGPTNAHATAIFDGCVSSASISVSTDESPPGSQDEPSSGTDDPSASATPASTDPEGEAVGNTNGCSNENCWCSGSCSCETCDCNVNDDFDGEGVTTKEQVIVYRWMPANSNAPWVPDWLGNLLNTLNSGLGLAPAPVGPVASGAGLALSVGQSLLSEPEMPNLGDPTLASPEPQPVVPAAPDPAEYDNWSSEVVDSYTVDWSPVDPFNGNYRIVGPPEFEVKRTIRPAVIANDGEYFPPGSYEEAVRFITTVNYVVEGSSSLPH